ncbi:MAG TPA: M1 family aminopeptidase [Terriglobales bacterium]|nr:M1 family aminopeptidase [Terriglobales bacterium]
MKRLIFLLCVVSLCAAERLPKTVIPQSYALRFTPDLAKNTFEGDETLRVNVLKSSSEIVLNAADIEFHEVTISSGGSVQTAQVNLDKDKETATLTVAKPITAGAATILIRYAGILNDQMRGFYIGKDDQGRKYAATQLEDTDARRMFPSFDEPVYKATFDITVVADKGLAVISNGRAISDTPGPGDKHTVHFSTTPKMSSYLVAIVVGNFEYVEGSADGIPVRVWATTGKKDLGNFALQAAEFNLHFYDQYFGIKYPYGKLDLVGIPDFSAGAMENSGCITFREVLLLVDKNTGISLKKTVASVIAHEMAHQWFGDLVTMKWWDDKWLNEGFATWMSSKPVNAWKPEWEVNVDNTSDAVNSLDLDSLVNTHPIHQPQETQEQVIESDDAITYGKAAAVLRMLESYLGPETFRKGVQAYLKKYSEGNATSADFWTAQTETSKQPVDKIMPTWVDQAGAPLLSVKTICAGKSQTLSFEQTRYFYDRAKLEQGNSELWQIPICIRPGSAASGSGATCKLMTQKTQTFSLPGCTDWDFVNANALGFYRSGYQTDTIRAMSIQAETALTPSERIMLLADVVASVTVNREPIGDYLNLAEGLKSDRNDAVLGQLLPQLTYVSDRLVTDADREAYRAWVRQLLGPIAAEVGWTAKPGERESLSTLRSHLLFSLAHVGDDPQAQAEAQKIVDQALADPNSVNHEISFAAFRICAAKGDAALYDKILADLKNAKTPEIYYRDVMALSQFEDPKLIDRTLQFAVSPDMRSQDSPYLISGLMQNPLADKQAWSFVQEHWANIEKLGGPYAAAAIVQATGAFCDAGMRDQVNAFFADHPAPGAQRSLKQATERMNYCVEMKTQQQEPLASWLRQREGSSGTAAGSAASH